MKFSLTTFLLIAVLCSSCAEKKRTVTGDGYVPLTERLNRQEGFTQDKEGNWKKRSDKRSDFEGVRNESMGAGKNYGTKEFHAENYNGNTQSQWGEKSYNKKSFEGNTDGSRFMTQSRYAQQSAKEAAKSSNEAGKNFATKNLDKTNAREVTQKDLDTPYDSETANHHNFEDVSIFDWRAKRAMEVNQTKSILGR